MATPHAHRTIMVVEDEPAIRGLLTLTLEAEDYDVVTAEDGQDALSKVAKHKPDALVLDLMLPKVDGWQVIDSLDHDYQDGSIPIIAVTAGARKVTVGEHGVRAFLSKPYDLDTLLVTLDQALQ